ncbi:YihY/virulence factor BrkB family protein [Candidatus Nomurabacteria bacterium]|nr:YihY/virulence factor BrkB family protein [Candidatus Nomurabacteria bacterium]
MQKTIIKKLPRPLRSAAKRTFKVVDILGEQKLGMLAASVAYYGAIAFFPLIVVIVAIGGLVLEPEQIDQIAVNMSHVLPSDIASLISTQLQNAMDNKSGNLMVAVIGFAVAVFGISGVVQTMITATNAAFEVRDRRNPIKLRFVSIVFTVGLILGLSVTLPLIFVGGDMLLSLGVPDFLASTYTYTRWVVLLILTMWGVAIFFRYGPDRERFKLRWLNPGVVFASAGWLTISAAFFTYLKYFANFNSSYSLFAGIISLMIWLNLSALIILIGAAINHTYDT